MLKTNSKQARENIKSYIKWCFNSDEYGEAETFRECAKTILDEFRVEKPAVGAYALMSEQQRFLDWAAGLPSILDTCYFYNRSAVDDLGAILHETESEKSRYSESAAEQLLTNLIYRELVKATC